MDNNYFAGSIPEFNTTALSFASFHVNDFRGMIPQSLVDSLFARPGVVDSIFALPGDRYDQNIRPFLSLSGNFLSCRIPSAPGNHTSDDIRSVVALGNEFDAGEQEMQVTI